MTDTQAPKAKIKNEQYVALLRQIGNIQKELNQMSAMIEHSEADRQSKDEDDECYDLYNIEKAIGFGRKKINEMKEMIGDVME